MDELEHAGGLSGYYLLPATQADLLRRLERRDEAATAYQRALALAPTEAERRNLSRRLSELTDTRSDSPVQRRGVCERQLAPDVHSSRHPFVFYGGFLLLGGRAADLLGRRRLFLAGTTLFGVSSLIGGLAASEGMLIGARLAQGLGAALMTPAALPILTVSFTEGADRVKAIGAWSATIPVASAVGVLAGGLLSEGPGWRWVLFVNLPVCAVVIAGATSCSPANARRF